MTLSKSDQHKSPYPICDTSASSRILRPGPYGKENLLSDAVEIHHVFTMDFFGGPKS